jgi:hypothetical protein
MMYYLTKWIVNALDAAFEFVVLAICGGAYEVTEYEEEDE